MTHSQACSYIAGFFDAEGCIHISKKFNVIITVSQQNPAPLLFIKNLYGGSFYICHNAFRWDITGKKAKQFLLDIRNFSIGKAKRIDLALKIIDNMYNRQSHRLSKSDIRLRNEIRSLVSLENFND